MSLMKRSEYLKYLQEAYNKGIIDTDEYDAGWLNIEAFCYDDEEDDEDDEKELKK